MTLLPYYSDPEDERFCRELEREMDELDQPVATQVQPTTTADRTKNPLRPDSLDEIIGQESAVLLMGRVIEATLRKDQPLDHVLLVGPSGVGKSTFSHVIAHELGVEVYEAEAPVSMDTLLQLREVMQDGDILRIEEIHQQAVMERRGRSAATEPEVLYALMEDFVVTSGVGVLPYPHITIIGTTTDEGMLPDPFLNRFPLRPRLESYTAQEMEQIAEMNAARLHITLTKAAQRRIANASRRIPRQVNNLLRNAALLADHGRVDANTAKVVIRELNGLTDDGLTPDMQQMIVFLYTRAKQTTATGDEKYQASVNTIATAIGKSRDSKAVALRVEPYLIEKGYVQVTHGGRRLTDEGIKRAKRLNGGRP